MNHKKQQFDIEVTEPDSGIPTSAHLIKKRSRELAAGARYLPHRHRWTQVALSMSGAVRASVFGDVSSVHIVLPSHGLWLPANMTHMIEAMTNSFYVSLYIHAEVFPATWIEPRVVPISALMRELVTQVDTTRTLAGKVRQRAVVDLLLDEILASSNAKQGIPLPSDRRLSSLCSEVLDDGFVLRTNAQLAAHHGLSERTLLRLSQRELHMSFAAWRRLVMTAKAVQALQLGARVADVATASGYRSISAFNLAFRALTGTTPGGVKVERRD